MVLISKNAWSARIDHVGMNIGRDDESRFVLFFLNAKSDFIGIFGANT
jgi:hypothetical protein